MDRADTIVLSKAEKNSVIALKEQKLGLAEMWAWTALLARGGRPTALSVLGAVASQIGQPRAAVRFLEQAVAIDPDLPNVDRNLRVARQIARQQEGDRPTSDASSPEQQERYLLIKAWGHGFWSDVSHVAVGALLAELTGRIPVVHWGKSSLYNPAPPSDCFARYFEPLSDSTATRLREIGDAIYPDWWTGNNLLCDEIRHERQPGSWIPASHYLARPEQIAVFDHYTSLASLRGWIPPASPLAALSLDELWLRQFRTAIRPLSVHRERAHDTVRAWFRDASFIAVHCRSTDKQSEGTNTGSYLSWLETAICELSNALGPVPILLLADHEAAIEHFRDRFGTRVHFTDSMRTNSDKPVHRNTGITDRYRLGTDILTESLMASHADYFVGLGSSNVSCAIANLRDWPKGRCRLFGPSSFNSINCLIYDMAVRP
jgi:protein O-GlcNAc transferase